MSDKSYFTKEGLQKVKVELKELKYVERRRIAAEIDEAREKGDLRENAEYHAAKEAQALLENKISKLETKVANAVMIDEKNLDTSKVYLLSTVKVKNLKVNKEQVFTLVPENEANLKLGKISMGSPVAKGLIGKKIGDIAEITVPAGLIKFEVLDITIEA